MQNKTLRYFSRINFIIILALLGACAGIPVDENPGVVKARQAYDSARTNAQVQQYAKIALRETQKALENTERAAAAGDDQADVLTYAYVTAQRAEIAKQTAASKAAQAEIETSRTERQNILLEARERELGHARTKTERAETQARASKREANLARSQAARKAREAELARAQAAQESREANAALARAQALQRQVAELKAQQTERGLVLTLGDVLFDYNKADLRTGNTRTIDKLANFLREYPKRILLIEGFTDSRGSEAYNKDLSKRRANAVQDALIKRGVDGGRMSALGYGEAYPVASNQTDAGRQQNRRVEVIISDDSGNIPSR